MSAAAVVAIAVFGCSSGSETPAVPGFASVVAERDVVDGKAQLTSTVRVMFDRNWQLAEQDLPFASLFELTVPDIGGHSKRVFINTATRSESNNRLAVLTVKELVPEGSTLTVERKAFERNGRGTISAEVEADLDPALVVLASQAMVVANPAMFDQPTTPPVTAADNDNAAQREALEKHLKNRPGDPSTFVDHVLAVYDAIPPEIVPSAKLRAALAGLNGTFAEPAISALLTSDNCTGKPAARIAFEPPPDFPDLLARVTRENGARVISVNPMAEGDRFEFLMPLLAHEAIHCDDKSGRVEEIASAAFDTFLYLQLVAIEPELASAHTRVARELNIDAVGMINSGQRYPESVGILPSIGVKAILPLTNSPAGSFAELVANAYASVPDTSSPPEQVAVDYTNILAKATGMDIDNPFDLVYLDELLSRAMDPGVFARAISAFGLVPER